MSELAVTHRGTVYPWQCDHMGHMNVMWYVGKFDEASWQLLSMLGLTRTRTREEGLGAVAVEQHITYKRELHAGDILTIRSTVLEIKDKSFQIFHEMRNDETGEVAATMRAVAIQMDVNARKARSIPDDIRSRALSMLGEVADPVIDFTSTAIESTVGFI